MTWIVVALSVIAGVQILGLIGFFGLAIEVSDLRKDLADQKRSLRLTDKWVHSIDGRLPEPLPNLALLGDGYRTSAEQDDAPIVRASSPVRIFCKNCLHYEEDHDDDECLRGEAVLCPVYGQTFKRTDPREKNKNFDCPDFEELDKT